MQDPNTANQGDLIFKLDQDRAWLLENLDKGKWPEIRSELAALENKIIILSRKTFPIKRNTTSLVVGYDYPENRSATLKMIDDFYKVYGIRIGIFDLQTILELNLIFLLTNKKPTWNTLSKMIGFAEIKNEIFKN